MLNMLPNTIQSINHLKQHVVTVANIDKDLDVNDEITRLLLKIFCSVYTYDEELSTNAPTIQDVMFQVRHKTHMKIVRIELTQTPSLEDYTFLFGDQHRQEMLELHPKIAHELDSQTPSRKRKFKTQLLCLPGKQVRNMPVENATESTVGFANIFDAMIADRSQNTGNTFDVSVVEVLTSEVRKTKKACYACHSRTCDEYVIPESTHMQRKLTLQIEMRCSSNAMEDYKYGPFPDFNKAVRQRQ